MDWVFFKEAVDYVRKAIANFEVNEEALQHARNVAKPLINQTADSDSLVHYGDYHRALDMKSLEKCGSMLPALPCGKKSRKQLPF
jgi:hypothetical protein